jgi:hypothetical protein
MQPSSEDHTYCFLLQNIVIPFLSRTRTLVCVLYISIIPFHLIIIPSSRVQSSTSPLSSHTNTHTVIYYLLIKNNFVNNIAPKNILL